MLDLTHYIDGDHQSGDSGRFAEVFNPATGEVEKRTPLASRAELDKAVAAAKAAQPDWAAQNPQKRARVFMKLAMLLEENKRAMAEDLSREHGKTIEDSMGDIQRGLEVVEFVIAAPHLLKGEFTEGAGPGIDMYSMRQPVGIGPAYQKAFSKSSKAIKKPLMASVNTPISARSASSARRPSRGTFIKQPPRMENALNVLAVPKTTWSSCPMPTSTKQPTH